MVKEKNDHELFLLTELKSGQERAFDFIFRTYYKSLCAQANSYVKDLDKAQSLVQDCFIKMWENRSNVDQIKALPPYLSFMVRNHCIDYLRKVKTQEVQAELDLSEKLNSRSEEMVFEFDFEERLVVALSLLPQRSREAFEYSRFENLSYAEISKKMGISVKGVEALISRALRVLRDELKEYLPILAVIFKLTNL